MEPCAREWNDAFGIRKLPLQVTWTLAGAVESLGKCYAGDLIAEAVCIYLILLATAPVDLKRFYSFYLVCHKYNFVLAFEMLRVFGSFFLLNQIFILVSRHKQSDGKRIGVSYLPKRAASMLLSQ